MTVKPKDLKDSMGRRRTQSLFHETHNPAVPYEPIYTLKEEEFNGLPSAKKIYMEQRDPTEYKAAMALLGSWEHWLRLLDNKIIRPYIDEWRTELQTVMQAEALQTIVQEAQSGSKSAVTAAKYIAERGWEKDSKSKNKGGRPSKDAIKREAKALAADFKDVEEDMKRLGIKPKEVN